MMRAPVLLASSTRCQFSSKAPTLLGIKTRPCSTAGSATSVKTDDGAHSTTTSAALANGQRQNRDLTLKTLNPLKGTGMVFSGYGAQNETINSSIQPSCNCLADGTQTANGDAQGETSAGAVHDRGKQTQTESFLRRSLPLLERCQMRKATKRSRVSPNSGRTKPTIINIGSETATVINGPYARVQRHRLWPRWQSGKAAEKMARIRERSDQDRVTNWEFLIIPIFLNRSGLRGYRRISRTELK